jgi:hypothetical protein
VAINAREEVPLLWRCSVAHFDKVLVAWKTKRFHFADLEPADTHYQMRREASPEQIQSILLPFHSSCDDDDQVDLLERIRQRKAVVEPQQR